MQPDRERDEIQSKLKRLSVSESYINAEKEAREEAQGLLKRLGEIEYESMTPIQRMHYDIEKQIGNET